MGLGLGFGVVEHLARPQHYVQAAHRRCRGGARRSRGALARVRGRVRVRVGVRVGVRVRDRLRVRVRVRVRVMVRLGQG